MRNGFHVSCCMQEMGAKLFECWNASCFKNRLKKLCYLLIKEEGMIKRENWELERNGLGLYDNDK